MAKKSMAEISAEKETVDKDKEARLNEALAAIGKQFGKNSITTLDADAEEFPCISSGVLSLDLALGAGYGKGRIVELSGPESSGKSLLSLTAVAGVQRTGGKAAYIDYEQALDPIFAKKLGVDVNKLLVSQPQSLEEGMEICEKLIKSNAIDIIIVDSTNAMLPKAEAEGEVGLAQMGLRARLLAQALRKQTGAIASSRCTVIYISQITMKVGVMFGSPEKIGIGESLKFFASQRLDVRRKDKITKGTGDNAEVLGSQVVVKVFKNKLAPPFRTAKFNILYEIGADVHADILQCGVDYDVITKAGNTYSYNGTKMAVGKEATVDFLRSNPEITSGIRRDVISAFKTKKTPQKEEEAAEDSE